MRRRFQTVFGTSMTAAISGGLLMLAFAATPVAAKPKILSNGCTGAQIMSAKAAQCIDQMEYDVRTNKPYHHALYCSSSGAMLCCVYRDGAQVPASCETIAGMPLPNQSVFDQKLLDGGSVIDRGSKGGTENQTAPDLVR